MMNSSSKTGTTQETIDNAMENAPKGKAEKKAGKRIGYNYIIIKSLKESLKNDVVKCFYIKGLLDWGICVIKEGTYGDSLDKSGRDIKARLIWQKELHSLLQDKVRIPRLIGSFEEKGNYYLVIERIKGKPLYKILRENRENIRAGLIEGNAEGMKHLYYLIQMIHLLIKMHKESIVHRDVTLNNFIAMPNGRIAVIDMELSYSTSRNYPFPPFQLGTRGYMSPEQEATLLPTLKEDIFSFGAILLQIWSGISPSKLTKAKLPDLIRKVEFIIPDFEIAQLAIRCLHPDPLRRPEAIEVLNVLVDYQKAIKEKKERRQVNLSIFTAEEINNTIQSAIKALASPLMLDSENGWFAENLKIKSAEKSKIHKSWYGSFSRGAAGVIYALCVAKGAGFDIDPAMRGIKAGMELIEKKYLYGLERSSKGLLFGSDGVSVMLNTAITYGLLSPQVHHEGWMQRLLQRSSDSPFFEDGWAGQGTAIMLCRNSLLPQFISDKLEEYAGKIIDLQDKDGSWKNKNRFKPGLHSGVSGIIMFLMAYGRKYSDSASLTAAEKGLAFLVRQSIRKGETYNWKINKKKFLPPHLCNGSVGIGLTFMKAYEYFGNPEYKKLAIGSLRNVPLTPFYGSLSQCHGLSSVGEVFLEAYRVFEDDEWEKRALHIVQLIMHLKMESEQNGVYWITENEVQPVANFMVGNSGILHFLIRFLNQNRIAIPLIYQEEPRRVLIPSVSMV